MDTRPFGTCFFEQYAQITLATLLGTEFASLVNRDRPDLQSPDGVSVGIEVTRAMEESKLAQEALLKDISGITPGPKDDDLFVCNLADGLSEGSRIVRYRILQEQRKAFYLEAIRRQNEPVQL